MIVDREIPRNDLLARLSGAEYDMLAAHLDVVDLPFKSVIAVAGSPIDRVYFPLSGLGSVIISTPTGKRAEAGVIGREGIIPTTVSSGTASHSYDVVVQVAGRALSLGYEAFRLLATSMPKLDHIARLSHEAFTVQIAYTALANTVQRVDLRLARWILMCHDRMLDDIIPITHEFLALMLAVRRPSVTNSLHMLESHGFIKSGRKAIFVRNRASLEGFANDIYGWPEARRDEMFSEHRPNGLSNETQNLDDETLAVSRDQSNSFVNFTRHGPRADHR